MQFFLCILPLRRIVALVHCFGDERRGFVADVTILAARITDACAWSSAIRFITRSVKHYSRYVGRKRPKRCAHERCQHLN